MKAKTETAKKSSGRITVEGIHRLVVNEVRKMTQKERVQSLVNAGILTSGGRLSRRYSH